ncbi:cell envelope integrity protein CreD [Novosphingobium sp.]|uniref:cell envelope integrity protein CreD n=1 Tax=Novosphingobium sp. TaxID=1874826 RepID=UPI003340071A
MTGTATRAQRSPAMKLLFVSLIAAALTVPLMLVYALVYDRQNQAATAQAEINSGWGGPQVLSGPIIVVPFRTTETQTVTENGKQVSRATEVEKLFYISAATHHVTTQVNPEERHKSIYRSVLYSAQVKGSAMFALPPDLERYGVTRERLLWDRAELRLGISDARGLTSGGTVTAGGKPLQVQPGKGPAASGGQGFFAFLNWDGSGELAVDYAYGLRGARSLSVVPRGGSTRWDVASSWPSPSFSGGFLPETRELADSGFHASYRVDKLALGQPPVGMADFAAPQTDQDEHESGYMALRKPSADLAAGGATEVVDGTSQSLTVNLIEPVNLYSKVNRSVKYGFLFIGFTFLTFLLFDIIAGARVASAEYLLTGVALVLFFVLLLALAELVGFTGAYLLASGATIGLLSAYSAAVLKTWRRGGFIGSLLVGLYALLFVLLNLEAWSLLIGALLLFVALAGVMYATRRVDWTAVGQPAGDAAG